MSTRRNDPCPCGSGKKYKRCHLMIEEEARERAERERDAQWRNEKPNPAARLALAGFMGLCGSGRGEDHYRIESRKNQILAPNANGDLFLQDRIPEDSETAGRAGYQAIMRVRRKE